MALSRTGSGRRGNCGAGPSSFARHERSVMRTTGVLSLALCLDLAFAAAAPAQVGTNLRSQKISGLGGRIEEEDYFGSSLAALGDVDGDGNRDLVVGAVESSFEGTRH